MERDGVGQLSNQKFKYTPDELQAMLQFIVGLVLAISYVFIVLMLLYALVFVTQPMTQAPNDKDFIETIKTLTTFLTGSLAGFLGAGSIKKTADRAAKKQEKED